MAEFWITWLRIGGTIYNIALNILASFLYAYITIGPSSLTFPGISFVYHHWQPILILVIGWSLLTVCAVIARVRQKDDLPPDKPTIHLERSVVSAEGASVVNTGDVAAQGNVHIGPRYDDTSLLMTGAIGFDLKAISQVARMQGAAVNAAKEGIDIQYDSQGNVVATVNGSKVATSVTFGVHDPESIVPGGDVRAAINNADTVIIPKEQLKGLKILIDGEDITNIIRFDTLTVCPLPLGQSTNCFLEVEGTQVRINDLLLELFVLRGGVAQITNKNQPTNPVRVTSCIRIPDQHGAESGKGTAVEGDVSSNFIFDLEKARFVRQLLAYHDFIDTLAQPQRIFIRDTANGELRYILRNTPVVASKNAEQANLIYALRCAQKAAGHQDLRLSLCYDDETRAKLYFLVDVVTNGKAEVPLDHVQPSEGIGIPTPVAGEILAHARPFVQFPLVPASEREQVDLFGARIDLGECYMLFPPLRMLISLKELRELIAHDPQAERVCIRWETIPAGHERVLLYYPRFLPDSWEEEASSEFAMRAAHIAMQRVGTWGAAYSTRVHLPRILLGQP